MQSCFKNNTILCRIPSHTSHRLQPCDIGVFGLLKAAYREKVERLYRGGADTIGKQHFTFLYGLHGRGRPHPEILRQVGQWPACSRSTRKSLAEVHVPWGGEVKVESCP